MALEEVITQLVDDRLSEKLSQLEAKLDLLLSTDRKPTTIGEKFITKRKTAELLGVSVRTIEMRMKAGLYRYSKSGNRVMILAEDVQKFLEKNVIRHR